MHLEPALVICIVSPISLCFVKEPNSGENTFNWVSKHKFSIQKVTWAHIASSSSSVPTTNPSPDTFPFQHKYKMRGKEEETKIFTKTDCGAQTLASKSEAGEGCVEVSLNLFTYPRKVQCQAQQCHSQRSQEQSAWLCWLLSWSQVPFLLPSGWPRTCLLLQKSGFPLLL